MLALGDVAHFICEAEVILEILPESQKVAVCREYFCVCFHFIYRLGYAPLRGLVVIG